MREPCASRSGRRSPGSSRSRPSRSCRPTCSLTSRRRTSPTSDFARLPVGSGPFAMTEMDEQRAILVPASGVLPAGGGGADGVRPAHPVGRLAGHALAAGDRGTARSRTSTSSRSSSTRTSPPPRTRWRPEQWRRSRGCPRASLETLEADATLDRKTYPTTTLSTVLLNLRPTHKELRDPKVRTALLAAIDRDALVADVLGGNATRADTLVPPGSWAYDMASAGSVAHDREGGRQGTQGRRLGQEGRQVGRARREGRLQAGDPDRAGVREPAAGRRSRRTCATPGRTSASRRRWSRCRWPISRSGCGPASTRRRSSTSRRALSRTCTRCSPPRRSRQRAPTSPATRMRPLTRSWRPPGSPARRRSASRRGRRSRGAGRPIPAPAARLERRGHACHGASTASPRRLIADTGDRYWDVLAWRLAADR